MQNIAISGKAKDVFRAIELMAKGELAEKNKDIKRKLMSRFKRS